MDTTVPTDTSLNAKIFLYAWAFYREQAEKLLAQIISEEGLAENQLSWVFEDPVFCHVLREFRLRFSSYLSRASVPEEDIENMIPLSSTQTMVDRLASSPLKQKEDTQKFIEALVNNFIRNLKNSHTLPDNKIYDLENTLGFPFQKQVEGSLTSNKTFEQIETEITGLLRVRLSPLNIPPSHADIPAKTVMSVRQELALAHFHTQLPHISQASLKLDSSYARFTDKYAIILSELVKQHPSVSFPKLQDRAKDIVDAVTVFGSEVSFPLQPELQKDGIAMPSYFFLSGAETLSQKMGSGALDIFLNFLPKEIREAAIIKVLERSSFFKHDLEKYFGKETVASPLFQKALKDARGFFSQQEKTALKSPFARSLGSSLGFFLSQRLVAGAFGSPAKKSLFAFLDLWLINAGLPENGKLISDVDMRGERVLGKVVLPKSEKHILYWQHFYAAGVYPHLVSRPHLKSVWDVFTNWIQIKAASGIIKTGTKAVIQKGVIKGLGALMKKLLIKLGLSALFDAALALATGGLSIPVSILKWAGKALIWLAKPVMNLVGKFFRGEIGPLGAWTKGISGYFQDMLGRGAGPPKPWYKDWGITGAMIPLLVVIVPLLLVLALPFSNSFMTMEMTRTSALVEGLGGEGTSEGEAWSEGPASGFCNPSLQNCMWPTSGCITQGPFASGTHKQSNAVDIGASNGTPVYSTYDGIVVHIRDTFAVDEKKKGSYGNYVDIQGTDDNGNTFITRYAHLMPGIPVSLGESVARGMMIGEVDNNGNSTGPHLHYEYVGGKSINTVLPFEVPSCAGNKCEKQIQSVLGISSCI